MSRTRGRCCLARGTLADVLGCVATVINYITDGYCNVGSNMCWYWENLMFEEYGCLSPRTVVVCSDIKETLSVCRKKLVRRLRCL